VYDLSDSIGELRSLGVDAVRISPQSHNTLAIVEALANAAPAAGASLEGCASLRRATATGTRARHGIPDTA